MFGQFLTLPPAAGIDDATAGNALQSTHDALQHIVFPTDDICQVASCKTHLQDILLAELQPLLYVPCHLRSGRSRKRKDGTVGEELSNLRYLQIRRAEIIAPLADAMCLIDRDKADLHATQLIDKHLALKPFGRDIQELVGIEYGVLQDSQHLFARHITGDVGSPYVAFAQSLNLVLHQGDKRREDNADALHRKGRHLERYTLAPARRHKAKCVAPLSYALDDITLDASEIIIAPVLPEYLLILCHSINYLPIQASGLSLAVSLRNWKCKVQLPLPSSATVPKMSFARTFCPFVTMVLERLQ